MRSKYFSVTSKPKLQSIFPAGRSFVAGAEKCFDCRTPHLCESDILAYQKTRLQPAGGDVIRGDFYLMSP